MGSEMRSAVRAASAVAAIHIMVSANPTATARRPSRREPVRRSYQSGGSTRRPRMRVTRMMVSTSTWVIARSGAPRIANRAAAP